MRPLERTVQRIFLESHELERDRWADRPAKEIYDYIKARGRATKTELMEQFKLPPTELEN